MSSKRLRALRNRQDRYKNNNTLKNEITESYMDNKNETISEIVADTKDETLVNENNEKIEVSATEQTVNTENTVLKDITADTKEETVGETVEEAVQEEPDFGMIEDPDAVPVTTTLKEDEVPRLAGAILKHAREKLGLSLNSVAHKLNLRVNSVADIEYDRLNQPTAVPFVSSHIANYAKLVNLDPVLLVNLYKDTVRTLALEKSAQAAAKKKSESADVWKRGVAITLSVAALILAISVAYMAFVPSSPKSAGALVIEDTVTPEVEANGSIVMDTENSKLKTNIVEMPEKSVDINTKIAKEQDEKLNSNALIKSKNQPLVNDKLGNETVALTVKSTAIQEDDAPLGYESDDSLVSVDIDTQTVVKDTQKLEQSAITVKKEENTTQKATVKNEPVVEKAQVQETVKPVKEEKVVKSVQSEEKAQLAQSTKDISSSVRLSGKRDPLAGVNSVTVKVTGSVALKITGNGKVLKQGSYKAGDTVVAMGITPIRIYVSDSSKIAVKYVGTTVKVPVSKQVNFELPQK